RVRTVPLDGSTSRYVAPLPVTPDCQKPIALPSPFQLTSEVLPDPPADVSRTRRRPLPSAFTTQMPPSPRRPCPGFVVRANAISSPDGLHAGVMSWNFGSLTRSPADPAIRSTTTSAIRAV